MSTSRQVWILTFVEGALLEEIDVIELTTLDSLQFLQIETKASSAALERKMFVSEALFHARW